MHSIVDVVKVTNKELEDKEDDEDDIVYDDKLDEVPK